MRIFFLLIVGLISTNILYSQFAPAAGSAGSTAVYKDSSIIVAWATGYQNYIPGEEVDTTWQHPEKALGQAEGTSGDIVCLGRGGQITLSFDVAIVNGNGPDFVCFENSFSDTFLELAWVEVSKDGNNFVRFPNYSYTQEAVSAFGNVDPEKISGYCSKYRQGYGTPFDLDSVNVDTVRFIRFIDIVGDSSAFDSNGNIIFDPYPTTGSAGMDLDAVGAINIHNISNIKKISRKQINIYPNPAKNIIYFSNNLPFDKFIVYSAYGSKIADYSYCSSLNLISYKRGMYFIVFYKNGEIITRKQFIKN